MINVSIACIACKAGRVLVAHRIPSGDMGGRWEFPGGKVEPGETEEQAVCREMNEEFGIQVTVGGRIAEGCFVHRGKKSLLHVYSIFVPHDGTEIPYTLTEHTEYKMVDPETIPMLDFVDSDLSVYPQVLDYLHSLKGGN
jgi:8-oxo-dGTP diphosphatase